MIASLLILPFLVSPAFASWNVTTFKIDLDEPAQRMKKLVASSRLPKWPTYSNQGFTHGTDLDWLKAQQHTWATTFDWKKTETHMNRFTHQKVEIEGVSLHFIHQRSKNASAIPILLSHGWPGSFYEFDRVIEPLANPEAGEQAFHVVVPSLPGYGFSSMTPNFSWTNNDTARIFTTLMTEVLGYESFGAEGGDWGSSMVWNLLNNHPDHVKAVVLTNLPRYPLVLDQYKTLYPNQTLSPEDLDGISRSESWLNNGRAYFEEQSTKPSTIGLALFDSPIGQLSWIGQQMYDWTDPSFTTPSTLTNYTILEEVSLYFLTQTFETSAFMYTQNPTAFSDSPASVRTPVGVSEYKHDILHHAAFIWPMMANVTYHVKHERGGHFPALDNPAALIDDLRKFFAANWRL